MRRPMVAGNWKMHGTRASVAELIKGLTEQDLPAGVDVAVFPSCLHLAQVVDGLAGTAVAVGAQDCAGEAQQGDQQGGLPQGILIGFQRPDPQACEVQCVVNHGLHQSKTTVLLL